MNKPLALGTKTVHGTVEAVMVRNGERVYFTIDPYGVVGMWAASDLEESPTDRTIRRLKAKLAKKCTKNKGLTKRVKELEKKCATARALFAPTSAKPRKQRSAAPVGSTNSVLPSTQVQSLLDIRCARLTQSFPHVQFMPK